MTDIGLLNKKLAAEYLSTSARTVDELRRSGPLRAVQHGKEANYKLADLDAYIETLPIWQPA